MAEQNTFTISRIELRRILTSYKVPEKNITSLIVSMEKAHRHINIIMFASLLEKAGMKHDKISNIFRRIGMDDVSINKAMNIIDEEKISSEAGRIYNVTLDMDNV
ncbi:hypothetical protein M1614_02410 [Candidatus Marsarchaeota archaeon]|jgi:hypothetical protein|nr:hypothetical protein [Candidatus Marsarchaeota archaeon]